MQKYKTISNGRSTVDESLFGTTRGNQILAAKRQVKPLNIPPSAVVITANELERLKNNATIKSPEEMYAEKEALQRQREDRERKARERKERMRELEKVAKQKAIKSDAEIEEEARNGVIRAMASDKLDKNHDVVKLLESMRARAVAFTLRDQQLTEKEKLKEVDTEYDRRMDIIMEVDRLKELKRREEEEERKRLKRVEDRMVITEQIEYRQKMKLLAVEAREQENQAMRTTMKKYEEEDERARFARQREVERSREEFVAANAEAIRKKKELKEQEKKDEGGE